jgi:hypothetical protein
VANGISYAEYTEWNWQIGCLGFRWVKVVDLLELINKVILGRLS